MQLSTSSLLLMSGVGVLISAISLLFLWLANRDIRAARYWALAPCSFAVGMVLFALQSSLPFLLRFILPNFFAQGAFLLIIIGLYLACDKPVPKRIMIGYFGTFLFLHSLFSFVFPSYQWRTLLGIITVTLSSSWIILVLYRYGRDKFKVSSILICLSLSLLFYFSANKIMNFQPQSSSSLQQDNSVASQLFIIAVFASQLLFNFAFAIMIGEYRNQKNKRYQKRLIETNNQLEQAKQEAEHHSELKSEFLANMSHEIRTPINGVIGSLELIEDHELTTQQARYKALASSSAHTLLGVINDILDFSKIESGKLTLHREEFDLYQLLDSVVKSLSVEAAKKDLALFIDTQHLQSRYIFSDPIRIRQVLTNLVSNAIKFTPEGCVEISVKLAHIRSKQWRLVVDIIDTGIGIEADATTKLFKSFSQCDASTTRVFGGTGLGLTIVKNLCQLMQGDAVLISSEKDKGSYFQFFVHVDVNQLTPNTAPKFPFEEVSLCSNNEALKRSISNEFNKYGISLKTTKLDVLNFSKNTLVVVDLNCVENQTQFNTFYNDCIKHGVMLGVIVSASAQLEKPYSEYDAITFVWHNPVTAFDIIQLSEIDENQEVDKAKKDLAGIKLLIAEDNPVNLIITERILENWQVEFVSAKNGNEVLNILKQPQERPFDVILMDCQMPELDGYETTQIIRNDDVYNHYKALPIIALTANAMKGDDEQCFEVGMNGYVSKPINSECLFNEIKKVIAKSL